MLKFRNTYYLLRHGETENTTKRILCSSEACASQYPLTSEGTREVMQAARELADKKIELIMASPLLRTRQTAELVAEEIKTPIEYDDRLREIDMGIFDGKSYDVYHKFFHKHEHSFDIPIPEGESWRQVAARTKRVIEESEQRYEHKNILIISHEDPLALLDWSFQFRDPKDFDNARFLNTGEWMRLEVKS